MQHPRLPFIGTIYSVKQSAYVGGGFILSRNDDGERLATFHDMRSALVIFVELERLAHGYPPIRAEEYPQRLGRLDEIAAAYEWGDLMGTL